MISALSLQSELAKRESEPMNFSRSLERACVVAARGVWPLVRVWHRAGGRPSLQPKWSGEALPKSHERPRIETGWPRETDSLCPGCVHEIRDAILSGESDVTFSPTGARVRSRRRSLSAMARSGWRRTAPSTVTTAISSRSIPRSRAHRVARSRARTRSHRRRSFETTARRRSAMAEARC